MHRKNLARVAAGMLVTLAATALALAAITGSLTVTVTDKSGAPLPGATVTISGSAQLGERSAVTAASGVARFNAVQPGSYKVVVTMTGYGTRKVDQNPVRLDENTQVKIQLAEDIVEEVTVHGKPPVVDTTTTATGQDLSRTYVDALPIGRDYLTNLARVPGVTGTGNASVRGATSTDNLFMIDGVNATDSVTGTFGTNINFEVIDQQTVQTGGHQAEYGSVVGMVSNVVTKSGGNDWSGSVNYTRNDADWQANVKPGAIGGSQTTSYDYSYTLGGPIVRDRIWHFTSYQKNYSETATQTDEPRPPRVFDGYKPFGKITWQVTPNHRLQAQYNWEDTDILNANASDTTIGQDQFYQQYQASTIGTLKYTGVLGANLILEGQLNIRRQNLDAFPQYPGAGPNTKMAISTAQFGRYSNEQYSNRDRDEIKFDATYFLPTNYGNHNLKAGLQYYETDFGSTNTYSGGEGYLDYNYGRLGRTFWGITSSNANRFNRWVGLARYNGWDCTIYGVACADQSVGNAIYGDQAQWVMTVGGVQYHPYDFVFNALSQNAQAAALLNAEGEPDGWIKFWRYQDTLAGADAGVGQHVLALYAQDDWQLGKWAVRAGLRIERQQLMDSNDDKFFRFDTTFAPRLGVTYDPTGDHKQKIFFHYGRLYDPLRDNTASFAGSLSAPQRDTQIYLGGPTGFDSGYYTFQRAGGPATPQAVMSPTVKTPKTDEFILGYSRELVPNLSLDVNVYSRTTKDITEDFDPIAGLSSDFTSPTVASLGFGDANDDGVIDYHDVPAAFIIYNPPGAKRKAIGGEVVLNRRFADNWQGMFSYAYNNTKGNVEDDGLFGSIGDDPELDPRYATNYGPVGYAREHVFQLLGSYRFNFGLSIGLEERVLSGLRYSLGVNTALDTSHPWDGDPSAIVRQLGIEGTGLDEFAAAYGLEGAALDQAIVDAVPLDLRAGRGAYRQPWQVSTNLRIRQEFKLYKKIRGEAFLDVFNVLNRQATISRQGTLLAVETITPETIGNKASYGTFEPLSTQAPRSFQVGARFSF